MDRLNGILMVTKSCTKSSCRDPWSVLQPPNAKGRVSSLTAAMDYAYDEFFSKLPKVHFGRCMQYQDVRNEQPYYPPGADTDLGQAYRKSTDNWQSSSPGTPGVKPNEKPAGGIEQRFAGIEELMRDVHVLTDEETGPLVPAEGP